MNFSHISHPDEDVLHYGVKGMKWGIRKSKKVTGISRMKGATVDRHNKNIGMMRKAQSKRGYSRWMGAGQLFVTQNRRKMRLDKKISSLENSRDRIQSGRMRTIDFLAVYGGTSPAAAFTERRK